MNIDTVWRKLSFFISSSHSQQYLARCYQNLQIPDWDKRSYENCYPFIFYLEHGKSYYNLAQSSPLSIKPVLLFYGMVQFLKACLLTVDPNYPESTSLLAHGVTTRKRKKQDYSFLQDEVKIQKNGLFSHAAEKLFHIKHLEGDKFTMEDLMRRIAELGDLFSYSKNETPLIPINSICDEVISIPSVILDRFHMTEQRFIEYMLTACTHLHFVSEDTQQSDEIIFKAPIHDWNGLQSSPLLYDCYKDTYYFPYSRDIMNIFPELLTHYLLLYNLSMISRYETEWWSELLRNYSSDDYPFIFQIVSLSSEKIPLYCYLFLSEKGL